MPSAANYPNLMQANQGILVEACTIMNAAEVEYVVVGGWVPFLRGKDHSLRHPGTHDVDLLFNGDFDHVKAAVPKFLGAGYLPSAKHPFQLLKELTVQGTNFVFNVDLMYPAEPSIDDDMLHDIIDLGVRKDDYTLETHIFKSIAFLSADVIFQRKLWSAVTVEATLPDGQQGKCSIPLMDERGLILSKCESVKGVKRGRDAFDIYFTLSGPNSLQIVEGLSKLAGDLLGTTTHLNRLKEFLIQDPDLFNSRVAKYANGPLPANCAKIVLDALP